MGRGLGDDLIVSRNGLGKLRFGHTHGHAPALSFVGCWNVWLDGLFLDHLQKLVAVQVIHIKLLLSGKILRTGFPVQQFHICASRGFFTLMAAKAINDH